MKVVKWNEYELGQYRCFLTATVTIEFTGQQSQHGHKLIYLQYVIDTTGILPRATEAFQPDPLAGNGLQDQHDNRQSRGNLKAG